MTDQEYAALERRIEERNRIKKMAADLERSKKENAAHRKSEAFICEDGRLGFTVNHPSGGDNSIDIFVANTLAVTHDGGWPPDAEMEEEALVKPEAFQRLFGSMSLPEFKQLYQLACNDWRVANRVLAALQGWYPAVHLLTGEPCTISLAGEVMYVRGAKPHGLALAVIQKVFRDHKLI